MFYLCYLFIFYLISVITSVDGVRDLEKAFSFVFDVLDASESASVRDEKSFLLCAMDVFSVLFTRHTSSQNSAYVRFYCYPMGLFVVTTQEISLMFAMQIAKCPSSPTGWDLRASRDTTGSKRLHATTSM